ESEESASLRRGGGLCLDEPRPAAAGARARPHPQPPAVGENEIRRTWRGNDLQVQLPHGQLDTEPRSMTTSHSCDFPLMLAGPDEFVSTGNIPKLRPPSIALRKDEENAPCFATRSPSNLRPIRPEGGSGCRGSRRRVRPGSMRAPGRSGAAS